MGKELIVVEEGVIQCEHGGKVVLTSTVPNHVIGGKKPLYDIDLLNTPVSGCTYNISNGGQCTKVVAISSAVTEDNVANQGKNYLLRVDGCKTDKGAALVLVDPGQTNTVVPAKSSGSGEPPAITALEGTKLDTKENIKKEKYRIYPLRRSSKQVRALRAARDFNLSTETYDVPIGSYRADKVVTKTEAYLYVTFEKVTREFKIINRGDVFNPAILDVQFIETEKDKKVIRRYIPFYKESGTAEFVYSNMQLKKDDLANFAPVIFTLGDSKATCVNHHKEISKSIKHDEKALSKKTTTTDKLKKSNVKYTNVLLHLDDPIGEVEDLYDDYEFSYKHHYGYNKPVIDDLRAKNQYPYAVADLLEYLYVDSAEQSRFDEEIKKLKKQYKIMVDGLEELGSYVVKNMIGLNLGTFIDYKTAKDYLDEIKFVDKAFFTRISTRGTYDEEHFRFNVENSVYFYSKDEDRSNYTHGFNTKMLFLQGNGYTKGKESASDTLAYVILTLYYSPLHKKKLEDFPKLKAAAESFYYLLKNAKPLPQINEKTKDEISDEMRYQRTFVDISKGKDSLLSEFENLDNYLKEVAFNPKKAAKKKAKDGYEFTSLKNGGSTKEFYYNKALKTGEELLTEVAAALKSKTLTSVLTAYMEIKKSMNDEEMYDYALYLVNLSYMLIAPRAKLDAETHEVSLFNTDNASVQKLILHLTDTINALGEENAQRLHAEPVKGYYLDALFTLIAHAKVEKPNYTYDSLEKKGSILSVLQSGVRQDKGRTANVESFLENFKVTVPEQKIDTANINDQNYDDALKLKTESATLYERLKQLDGISSYVDKFDGTMDDFGGQTSNADDPFKKLRKSTPYKTLLTSSKALSFFMAAGNILSYTQSREKFKATNLVSLAGDVLAVSGTVVNIAKEPVVKLTIPGAKGLSKVSVPESLEHVAKLDKIVSPASMKVIARFGLIGPVVGAVNELSEINREENGEYFIAVGAKNAIYLGLLFSPALIALGGVALTEVVWYFLKDYIENSRMELYLYESLLFNTTEHNDNRYFNTIESNKSFRAGIFVETLKHSNVLFTLNGKEVPASELNGFVSAKEVREFIAENYDEHSNVINTAMTNELAQLKSVLYGYSITRQDAYSSTPLSSAGITINVQSKHGVKLSKSLYDEAKEVYVTYDKAEADGIYKTVYEKLPKQQTYDITAHLVSKSSEFDKYTMNSGLYRSSYREKQIWMGSPSQTQLVKEILKNVSIIAVCENINVKYDVTYTISFRSANNQADITEIKTASLTEGDYQHIKDENA